MNASGSAINPADFNKNTKDPDRHEWTPGQMRHLVRALGDTPVAIVLEKATGFSLVNVQLRDVRKTPGYGTFQVLVAAPLSDGTIQLCWYSLNNVGTVIILGASRARWTALDTFRKEESAAKRKAYPLWEKQYEGRQQPAGKWTVRSSAYDVTVSFMPDSLRDQYDYWTFPAADLLDA